MSKSDPIDVLAIQAVPVKILVPLFGVGIHDQRLGSPDPAVMERTRQLLGVIAPQTVTRSFGQREPAMAHVPRPRR